MDNLKSTTQLWVALAKGLALDRRDVETVQRRTLAEGLRFLTESLPSLGKDLDRVLITGEPLRISGRFAKYKASSIPLLFHALFLRVVDINGNLREKPHIQTIAVLRQMLYFCYKLKVPHDRRTLEASYSGFISRDSELNGCIDWAHPCLKKARALIGRILCGVNPYECIPRHGPGAVSERRPVSDRWHQFAWHPRLNRVFPYEEFFYYNLEHFTADLQRYLALEVVEEPVARIVAVPKDSRGPRLICCEPQAHQYVQQGLMRILYKQIESHPYTAGFVNFTNQSCNGELAQLGSEFGILATLDLKDASDRVRWDIVKYLFPGNWVEAFDACRTRLIDCNGTIIEAKKFAPMGSAVCFPVEALVFWALLRSAVDGPVWVYGDDILVETRSVNAAIHCLESFDLKVNIEKSCWRTPFRESCGYEFFDGIDVSYVKLRSFFGQSSYSSRAASIQLVNLLTERWGSGVSYRVKRLCDEAYGPIPSFESPESLAYHGQPSAVTDVFFKKRWNRETQVDEYFLPTIVTPKRRTMRSDYSELLRKECVGFQSDGSPFGGVFENYSPGEYPVPEHCSYKFRWRAHL